MAIGLILISAVFAALQNIFMRRSVDTGGSTLVYVPIQLAVSLGLAILLNPVREQSFGWDTPTAWVGIGMGALLGIMMWSLGQSLKFGASSLSFAILNSSSVLPAVLMAAAFGATLGHPYQWWNGVGSALVVVGIFWGMWSSEKTQDRVKWAVFITLATTAYVYFSAFMQWRVLLEIHGGEGLAWLPVKLDAVNNAWFMPCIFFSATLLQVAILLSEKGWKFSSSTLGYGILGGISNGSSMFFMVLATEAAKGWENAVIWPVFSIAVIQICNIWGRYVYQEEVKWQPNLVCVVGLVVGSIQWSLLTHP